MAVILVIAESDLMHRVSVESDLQVRLQIPKLTLHSAVKALKETPHHGYVDHNWIIVPVQTPEKPTMVADEIGVMLMSVIDTGEHQEVYVPVSAAATADRFDGWSLQTYVVESACPKQDLTHSPLLDLLP